MDGDAMVLEAVEQGSGQGLEQGVDLFGLHGQLTTKRALPTNSHVRSRRERVIRRVKRTCRLGPRESNRARRLLCEGVAFGPRCFT
jgi:hypothetical protein